MPTIVRETIGTGGDYADPSTAEAATDNDLVTADELRELRWLENFTPDVTLSWLGEISDATRYRDMGPDDPDDYYNPITGTGIIDTSFYYFRDDYQRWWGFGINGGSQAFTGRVGGVGIYLQRMYLVGGGANQTLGMDPVAAASPYAIMRNCIIVHHTTNTAACNASQTPYNPTISNCLFLNYSNASGSHGISLGNNSPVVRNCIALVTHASAAAFNSTGAPTWQTNRSSDSTGGDVTARTWASVLKNAGYPTFEDYRPVAGGPAANAGTDLSGVFTESYEYGFPHGYNATGWDIGPYNAAEILALAGQGMLGPHASGRQRPATVGQRTITLSRPVQVAPGGKIRVRVQRTAGASALRLLDQSGIYIRGGD